MQQLLVDAQLRVLQESDLHCLKAIAQPTTHPAATVLIQQGKVSEFIYLSLNSSLDVTLPQSDATQPLITLRAGEIFGKTSLLDENQSQVAIAVAEPAAILALPRKMLIHLDYYYQPSKTTFVSIGG